ncbi:MAG: BMP family ABC transporter substrate-binding protein [Bdellovibrionota bacterium]
MFKKEIIKYLTVGLGISFLSGVAIAAPIRVGLVLDKGGKDDKSFNAAAYLGANQAKNELGILLKVVEATDDNAFEPMLRAFAQKDFELIIGIGFAQMDAVKKVSSQFPDKHFVIVDSEVNAPNVSSLMFEEHEASYLVGAIAAWTSKTGKIGYIGGMDIPLIRRFEMGFKAGAEKANPKIRIFSNFIGVTGDSWNNPAKAKELALSQYQSGADVVFAAAGASNVGLFDAAEEKKKFAIGVDSNQNWIKPGFVLTSMLKRVDLAVFAVCKDASQGKFKPGLHRFGLQNSGVDYAMDQYNSKVLSPEVREKAEKLKAEIIAGKIKVPDYYLKKK